MTLNLNSLFTAMKRYIANIYEEIYNYFKGKFMMLHEEKVRLSKFHVISGAQHFLQMENLKGK